MLKVDDVVYIYLIDIEKSVNNAGICENRIGKITNIEPVIVNGKEEGIYTVKSINEKEWKINTYSNNFKLCSLEELVTTIKYSTMDEKRKEEIIELIYNI